MKILFVEDNPVTSKAISKLLKNKGHRVISAMTLEDALEAINKEKRFTHLICDYDLYGESGLEAVAAFKEKFPNGSVMIFTGQRDFLNQPEVAEFMSENFYARDMKIEYKPIEQDQFFSWFNELERARGYG